MQTSNKLFYRWRRRRPSYYDAGTRMHDEGLEALQQNNFRGVYLQDGCGGGAAGVDSERDSDLYAKLESFRPTDDRSDQGEEGEHEDEEEAGWEAEGHAGDVTLPSSLSLYATCTPDRDLQNQQHRKQKYYDVGGEGEDTPVYASMRRRRRTVTLTPSALTEQIEAAACSLLPPPVPIVPAPDELPPHVTLVSPTSDRGAAAAGVEFKLSPPPPPRRQSSLIAGPATSDYDDSSAANSPQVSLPASPMIDTHAPRPPSGGTPGCKPERNRKSHSRSASVSRTNDCNNSHVDHTTTDAEVFITIVSAGKYPVNDANTISKPRDGSRLTAEGRHSEERSITKESRPPKDSTPHREDIEVLRKPIDCHDSPDSTRSRSNASTDVNNTVPVIGVPKARPKLAPKPKLHRPITNNNNTTAKTRLSNSESMSSSNSTDRGLRSTDSGVGSMGSPVPPPRRLRNAASDDSPTASPTASPTLIRARVDSVSPTLITRVKPTDCYVDDDAALLSDVESSIEDITSGHRVTTTSLARGQAAKTSTFNDEVVIENDYLLPPLGLSSNHARTSTCQGHAVSDLVTWSVDRVAHWCSNSLLMPTLAASVIGNNVDGEMLALLTWPDLCDLGISDNHERTYILDEIHKLNTKFASTSAPLSKSCKFSFEKIPVLKWDNSTVLQWLEINNLNQFYNQFRDNNVNGNQLCNISLLFFEKLSITRIDERELIISALGRLQEQMVASRRNSLDKYQDRPKKITSSSSNFEGSAKEITNKNNSTENSSTFKYEWKINKIEEDLKDIKEKYSISKDKINELEGMTLSKDIIIKKNQRKLCDILSSDKVAKSILNITSSQSFTFKVFDFPTIFAINEEKSPTSKLLKSEDIILYINGIYVCGMSRDTVEEIISRGDTEYIIIRSQEDRVKELRDRKKREQDIKYENTHLKKELLRVKSAFKELEQKNLVLNDSISVQQINLEKYTSNHNELYSILNKVGISSHTNEINGLQNGYNETNNNQDHRNKKKSSNVATRNTTKI